MVSIGESIVRFFLRGSAEPVDGVNHLAFAPGLLRGLPPEPKGSLVSGRRSAVKCIHRAQPRPPHSTAWDVGLTELLNPLERERGNGSIGLSR